MGEVMDICVSLSIPNVQLKGVLVALRVINIRHLREILHDVSAQDCSICLHTVLHEGIDDRCFANLRVSHEDDL